MNGHRWTRSVRVVLLGLALMLTYTTYMSQEILGDERPTNPDIGSDTLELLSYQTTDYRYLFIPLEATPPAGFELPDFDDTGFAIGSAAFGAGSGGAGDGIDCPLQQTVQTYWAVQSQLLVRRAIEIPEGAISVRIMVAVDSDIVGVFFNGIPIAENIPHSNCPILDEFRFDVPQSLVQPGRNLVAFHLLDRPPDPEAANESFFDTRILAEITISELGEVVAGLQRAAVEAVPAVSLSDVSTSECELPTTDGVRARVAVGAMVDATGQRARVIVTAGPQRSAVSVENLLDDQTMHTVTLTPDSVERARVTVMPGTEPSTQRALTNVNAFPTVLPQPRVISQILECFVRLDQMILPTAPCQENIDIAESNCQRACAAEANAADAFCTNSAETCAIARSVYSLEVERCISECATAAAGLRSSCPS